MSRLFDRKRNNELWLVTPLKKILITNLSKVFEQIIEHSDCLGYYYVIDSGNGFKVSIINRLAEPPWEVGVSTLATEKEKDILKRAIKDGSHTEVEWHMDYRKTLRFGLGYTNLQPPQYEDHT